MTNLTQTLSDSTLPHLATALDCAAMGAIFADKVAQIAPAIRVLDCQIERMKYKPGKSCLVAYRLSLGGEMDGEQHEQRICARCYPVGESQRRFDRAQNGALIPVFGEASLLHFPELSMVAWLFPNEPKLKGLPRLLDRCSLQKETVPAILHKLGAAQATCEWQIDQLNHSLVHYAPEHTCTVRLQVEAHAADSTQRQSLVLYGKTYYNEDGAETYRLMSELWHEHVNKADQLILAQPLDYDPQQRILWQQGLAGQPLLAFEAAGERFVTHLRRAAKAVAALHQSQARSSRTATVQQWLDRLNEMRSLVAKVRPECQAQSEALIDQLIANSDLVDDAPTALLHGDLHLQNFLVHENTIAMIDMDNLVNGSPWQDIGSFAAGLYYRGLLCNQPRAETERLVADFCDGYVASCRWHISPDAIKWYTAAALINERVYRTISRWKGGKLAFIDALLDCAEKVSRS